MLIWQIVSIGGHHRPCAFAKLDILFVWYYSIYKNNHERDSAEEIIASHLPLLSLPEKPPSNVILKTRKCDTEREVEYAGE